MSTMNSVAPASRSDAGDNGNSALSVLFPPETVCSLGVVANDSPATWVRFEDHPAYSTLIASTTTRHRVSALVTFLRYFFFVLAKRLVAYELIRAHLRRPRTPVAVWQLVRHVLGRWLKRKTVAPVSAKDSLLVVALKRNLHASGCAVFMLPDSDLDLISKLSASLFAHLRETRGERKEGREFEESRTQAFWGSHTALFDAIESSLSRSGALRAISLYLGREARIVDINPQINDLSDDFWRRFFPGREENVSRTAYLHRDASGGDIKVMIYLSDVGSDNGPFSYILNSHSYTRPPLQELVAETNDHCGFSGTEWDARMKFSALPKSLRKKCAFGNDIGDTNPISEKLLAAEWKITGKRGTTVIFDSKGFHRGGMVKKGERVVITCIVG